MTAWLALAVLGVLVGEIVCPPVQPEIKPVELKDGEELNPGEEDALHEIWDDFTEDVLYESFGLEYERYLREVVMALEEDDAFRKKLEEMNMTDIKNGKIAMHLELVSHQIREKLDEIKRQEIGRLRQLARQKMKQMNGIQEMDKGFLHHVNVENPHSFESGDLEKLIKKATNDLDEIDKKRRNEFKTYEMEKEHQRREELKGLNEEQRHVKEEEQERLKKRHQEHDPVHHPGSKAQLEEVWEKGDHMDPDDFNPKTFFKMHDMDNNGFLDQDEVEALFQKELDQVYDPNLPEDDMRERYEEMARMREHVVKEVDTDGDHLISLEEFLKYTASNEFQKDEGWKTVDEAETFTDEEYERYEQMLREHEERLRAQGIDPNQVQPGMVPVGHDANVQNMQIPQGQGQQMNQQQQQQLNQQQQQQLHLQQQQFQQQQQQFQQQQMGQMGGVPQGQMPQGQAQMQGQPMGGPPGHMGQGQPMGGQMPGGPMGGPSGGQMRQGQPMGGQMPSGPMGGPPGGHMGQGQPIGNQPQANRGQGMNPPQGGADPNTAGESPESLGQGQAQGQIQVDLEGQGQNIDLANQAGEKVQQIDSNLDNNNPDTAIQNNGQNVEIKQDNMVGQGQVVSDNQGQIVDNQGQGQDPALQAQGENVDQGLAQAPGQG